LLPPEAVIRIAPRPFLLFSCALFLTAAPYACYQLPSENDGVMSCATKGIMCFEDMRKENVNGNIHFDFGRQGKGSMA
ncbi:hypothetical protein ACETWN_22440, partial [Aeromonas hydrophila]